MDQLRMKLKTAKTKITKNMNKIEPVIILFEKYEKEGASAFRINSKAKEIRMYLERLENEEIEINTITSILREVIHESELDELKCTKEHNQPIRG